MDDLENPQSLSRVPSEPAATGAGAGAGSTVRLREPQSAVLPPAASLSLSQTTSRSRRFQWCWKQISFFIISIIVLAFGIAGAFTGTLSRDQAIGIISVIVSSNLPSPLLDLQKPKKKYYFGAPPTSLEPAHLE
jgi:hypothetical protein